MLNDKQLKRIIDGENLICFHILGQGLVNNLCDTIRVLNKELEELRSYKENIENQDIPGEDN